MTSKKDVPSVLATSFKNLPAPETDHLVNDQKTVSMINNFENKISDIDLQIKYDLSLLNMYGIDVGSNFEEFKRKRQNIVKQINDQDMSYLAEQFGNMKTRGILVTVLSEFLESDNLPSALAKNNLDQIMAQVERSEYDGRKIRMEKTDSNQDIELNNYEKYLAYLMNLMMTTETKESPVQMYWKMAYSNSSNAILNNSALSEEVKELKMQRLRDKIFYLNKDINLEGE